MTLSAPLVVVGSANADIFVEVDTLPKEGERIVAKSGQTFAGGKGASQASCAARLSYPTYFVGQVWNALLLLLLASIRHPHVSASLDRPRLER
jgi:fructose-1-phosphate kinase PfkB-like protein